MQQVEADTLRARSAEQPDGKGDQAESKMALPYACSHVSTSFGNFIPSAILKQEKGFSVSLKEYAQKRSFAQTPEPKPDQPSPAAPAGNFFCVQRHHATRLH